MFIDAEAELQTAEANDAAVMKTSRAFPATRHQRLITSRDAVTHSRLLASIRHLDRQTIKYSHQWMN